MTTQNSSLADVRIGHLSDIFDPGIAIPVFGYIVPLLALFVVIINSIVVFILTKKHMRSPTHNILIAIAVSDTLTILVPAPAFVNFYTFQKCFDFVPFNWCRTFFYTVHVIPSITNMASIWFSVVLAFMRCYCVTNPMKAGVMFTTSRTKWIILVVYAVSFAINCVSFFEYDFTIAFLPSIVSESEVVEVCEFKRLPSLMDTRNTYVKIHIWLELCIVAFIPCPLLIFLDAIIILKLIKAEHFRIISLGGHAGEHVSYSQVKKELKQMPSYQRQENEIYRVSLTIMVVVTIFCVVEIPYAIFWVVYLTHVPAQMPRTFSNKASIFIMLVKYVSYPCIFIIYCCMSSDFRANFCNMFLCRNRGTSQNLHHVVILKQTEIVTVNDDEFARCHLV